MAEERDIAASTGNAGMATGENVPVPLQIKRLECLKDRKSGLLLNRLMANERCVNFMRASQMLLSIPNTCTHRCGKALHSNGL